MLSGVWCSVCVIHCFVCGVWCAVLDVCTHCVVSDVSCVVCDVLQLAGCRWQHSDAIEYEK